MTVPEWLLLGLGILVVLLYLLRAVNAWVAAVARRVIPKATWAGTWKSNLYPLVSGYLFAALPDPVPCDETFEVDVSIYYNLWSLYRPGGTVQRTFTGLMNADSTASGSAEGTPTLAPIKMSFLSFADTEELGFQQVIEFVATRDFGTLRMVGGYRSLMPLDCGHFVMRRY